MKKTLLKSLALVAVGSFCLVGSALAAQMTGGIGMAGAFIPVDVNGVLTTILDSTGINFVGDQFEITSGTGDLAVLFGGPNGVIKDFQFDLAPIEPFWSAGVFSFDMFTYTANKIPLVNTPSYILAISGTGTLNATGFDPTPGIWNFSAQGAGGANFSWSASTNANPVPEPATMLLFGTGLIGLAGVGRRLRK